MNRLRFLSSRIGQHVALCAAIAAFTTGSAGAASVSAPDVVFSTGTSGQIAIAISDAPTSAGYTGVDLVLRYDSDVANATRVTTAGTATDGWDFAFNVIEDVEAGNIDELRISAASSTKLDVAGTGTLLIIVFDVADASVPIFTALTFELAELNETAVTATDGSIAIGGDDASIGLTPSSLLPGALLTVSLTDSDLAGNGSATVRVINGNGLDSETITLTESGSTPGDFSGTISTVFDVGASAVVNGVIGAQKNDVITAEFDDALGADGTASTVVSSDATILGGTTGILELSPATLFPGDDIDVQLTDPDLAGSVTIAVTVSNFTTGDNESLTLNESPPGIFSGTIATVYDDGSSVNVNGNIGVKKDDVIKASYDDAVNNLGGPETVAQSSPLTVLGGDTGDLTLSPASLFPGDPLTIQVIDLDLTSTPSIPVTVLNSTTGDSESLTLTETSSGSGTFTGSIDTEFDGGATGNSGNNLLGIKSGDKVTSSYDDARNVDGGPETINPTGGELTVSGGVNGTVVITPASMTPGGSVTITVVDADLSVSVDVIVRSRDSGGTEKETVVVALLETDPGTFVFVGTAATVFGVAAVAGGDLDVQKDDTIEAEYDDALTSTGGTATLISPTTTLILGGTTGTLTTSTGVQAGDSLRIELTDPDLNTNPTTKQQVDVTVKNLSGGGDLETVSLEETGVNTGVFRIEPPMPTNAAGGSGDDILQVSPQDLIETSYADPLNDVGGPTAVTVFSTGTLWGDTSKNGTVRALDASLILQENVAILDPAFDAYQNLVGDVDPTGLNASDASLVLQFVVGIITTFPVQTGVPNPHPYKRLHVTRRLAVGAPQSVEGHVRLPILADDLEGLLAGNLTLSFDEAQIRVVKVTATEHTQGFMVVSHVEGNTLRIAFAGAEIRDVGEGALLEIEVEPLRQDAVASLRLEEASLNGGETPVQLAGDAASLTLPDGYALLQNWPNPFNPETQLRYQVAEQGPVRLRIFDLTGQQIAELVSENQSAGTYTVRWNGFNDGGHSVATGIYFYRLEAGGQTLTRKMSLVR